MYNLVAGGHFLQHKQMQRRPIYTAHSVTHTKLIVNKTIENQVYWRAVNIQNVECQREREIERYRESEQDTRHASHALLPSLIARFCLIYDGRDCLDILCEQKYSNNNKINEHHSQHCGCACVCKMHLLQRPPVYK